LAEVGTRVAVGIGEAATEDAVRVGNTGIDVGVDGIKEAVGAGDAGTEVVVGIEDGIGVGDAETTVAVSMDEAVGAGVALDENTAHVEESLTLPD